LKSVTEHSISASHPSLPGHFPGHPVVPGVVLLDEVVMAIMAWQPAARILGFQAVKFLQPVAPGRRFSIALTRLDGGKIGFRCSSGEQLLNSGTVILQGPQGQA
jgi:3-hydroxymyristoyl/3-hydroxydecanoyl-(acyl carrier protein) dehydratase